MTRHSKLRQLQNDSVCSGTAQCGFVFIQKWRITSPKRSSYLFFLPNATTNHSVIICNNCLLEVIRVLKLPWILFKLSVWRPSRHSRYKGKPRTSQINPPFLRKSHVHKHWPRASASFNETAAIYFNPRLRYCLVAMIAILSELPQAIRKAFGILHKQTSFICPKAFLYKKGFCTKTED